MDLFTNQSIQINSSLASILLTTTMQLRLIATTTKPVTASILGCPVIRRVPLSDLPTWFVESVVLPYDANVCDTPRPLFENSTYFFTIPIDRMTGERLSDHTKVCWNYLKRAKFLFLFSHYYAFGIIPSSAIQPVVVSQEIVCISHLMLYVTPIVYAVSGFGLYLVHKVLAQTESSHVYIYHRALVYLDGISYLYNSLLATYLVQYVLPLPGCLLSPFLALNLEGYASINLIITTSLYSLLNMIQALLGLDRVFALYSRNRYLWYGTPKNVKWAIFAVMLANGLLTIGDLLANAYHAAVIFQQATAWTPFLGKTMFPTQLTLQMLRTFSLCLAILTQAASCCLVFAKLWRQKKKRLVMCSAQYAGNIHLLPCYLLAGTCFLGVIGSLLEVFYQICLLIMLILTSANPTALWFAVVVSYIISLRHISTAFCSSCSVYVHLAVSPQCRKEATKMIRRLVKQLFGNICSTKRVSQPNPEVAFSAALEMKQQSTASPGHVDNGTQCQLTEPPAAKRELEKNDRMVVEDIERSSATQHRMSQLRRRSHASTNLLAVEAERI